MNSTSQLLISRQTCLTGSDSNFGPSISPSCRSFDFTLYFEQIFLSLVPSLLFILFAPIRLAIVHRQDIKTEFTPLHAAKIVTSIIYATLQIPLLVLWCISSNEKTPISIPAATISFVAGVFICILSHFEHAKTVKPSLVINSYLFFSVLFDPVQLRTLWMIRDLKSISTVFSASFSAKFTLLVLEAIEKGHFLKPPYRWTTPEGLASIYNLSVFYWLNQLFRSGFKKALAFQDLYSLDSGLVSEQLSIAAHSAWNKVDKSGKHALIRSTITALKWQLLEPAFPRLCLIGFDFAQPFLIHRTVNYVGQESSSNTKNVGYGLIAATGIIYIGRAVSTGRYQHSTYRSITVIRGAMVSMIYSKTLKLKFVGSQEAPAVTLMSQDVSGITTTLDGLHDIWASTVQVAIGMWLLWHYAGIGFIVPLILAFISVGVNYFIVGKKMVGYRKVWNEAVQSRIALASSSLREMKSLRMMGLGPRLQGLLQSQRIRELYRMKGLRYMIIWMNVMGGIARLFSPAFIFMVYTVSARNIGGPPLNAAQAYAVLSILNLTIGPLSIVLTRIPSTMSSIACFDRIQEYLLRDERADERQMKKSAPSQSSEKTLEMDVEVLPSNENAVQRDEAILLQDLSLSYSADANAVQGLTSSFKRGALTMIIGPVGTGKSTLLLGLLGELRSGQGNIYLGDRSIGYCSQSAWLPNGTVKEIIIGSSDSTEEVDRAWLETVLHVCTMDVDIQLFPDAEDTVIGSRGLTLSGGQRQRLALARAVYQRKSILLLDDIFSALDAKTEALVFNRLFSDGGVLRQLGTTVILATHAVHHMRSADYIVALGAGGKIVEQGTFLELDSSNGYIRSLAIAEARHKREEPEKEVEQDNDTARLVPAKPQAKYLGNDARRLGDFTVYNYYRKALTLKRLFLFLVGEIFSVTCYRFIQLLVGWWSAANGRHTNVFIGIAFLLPFLALASQMGYLYIILVNMGPLASRRLHWILTRVVFAAPLAFFTDIDSGVILNRFSQDMTIIDIQLPIAVLQTVHGTFEVLWSLILMCYGSYYLLATLPLLGAIIYGIQMFYLRTSRQLRILDLELQSPLFTQFTETIEGLATIRAFGWQQRSLAAFFKRLDASQRPYYLLYCIQRWLNFVMDLLVACMAVLLISFATQFKNTTSGVAIGIAMLNALTFGENVAALIQHWTTLETSIGAVARLKQLEADIKPETVPANPSALPPNWPGAGTVTFHNVSASYKENSANILHDINLEIKAGEKIGICGRTGSGKSTLIGLLFRLLPEHKGIINIDDQDLSSIKREDVRRAIIVIPQEPVLLPGDVRFNALPHTANIMSAEDAKSFEATESFTTSDNPPVETVSDQAIIDALTKVALWPIIEQAGGLNTPIDKVGLSHGQKQLFCLARALLRKHSSRILVLDEATSSVDKDTDAVMRAVIQEEFKDHTVISVAHRLSSLGGCERVVVMDQGKIVEVGGPDELMKEGDGWWKRLWQAQN